MLGGSVRLWANVACCYRVHAIFAGGFTMRRCVVLAGLLCVLLEAGVLLETRQVALAEVTSFTFTTINFPGNNFTEASGINPRGQIVGDYNVISSDMHGFLDDDGVFTTIDVPGASSTQAVGIGPRGQIVGDYFDSTGSG